MDDTSRTVCVKTFDLREEAEDHGFTARSTINWNQEQKESFSSDMRG